jgi:signal transduction histidine kinase
VVAGIAVLVVAVYLVVVVGLGRAPVDSERDVLVSSIVAALVVAVLALPVRARLVAAASNLVGRDPGRTDEVASFGARMNRAVPMDELLLQLAESLRAGLAPAGAEVWVGADGVLERTVAVPDRPPAHLELGVQERVVVGRARSGGARWMSVWLPGLLAEHHEHHGPEAPVRAVPVAHLGALLGLLVVHRVEGADAFTDDEERVLVELARQLGLALHNVALDSALEASVEELRRRNAELQASRARIVTAADESRREIERNLHDGAQQHLVALAVKIGLVRAVLETDPASAPALLEQLRGDAQAAIGAVRDLAHGIYPPLLRERGLGEALRTAASRSPLTCAVEVELPARYPQDVETCVYFCCLEAIQNAGKHAGAEAVILVHVDEADDRLRFSISDDGAGFEIAAGGAGHGFVNMRDRLGAVGGDLQIVTAPGAGTTVSGSIPVGA